jgi:hypothetical protein
MGKIGQSAIITLSFPYGARTNGMGEVGASLADDESCLFWNPAGLGIVNERWHGGSSTFFREPLLPAFDLPDLWHYAYAVCYQHPPSPISPLFDIGGFGLLFNYLSFGINEQYNAFGKKIANFNSYEFSLGFSYGFNYAEFGLPELATGITVKYAHSALAPGIDKHDPSSGIGQTFAIDLGMLYVFPFGLRLGLTLQNMGPSVYYIDPTDKDPIPFTVVLAIGYKKELLFNNIRLFRICTEYNANREMVYNELYEDPDPFWKALFTSMNDQPIEEELEEIIHNYGLEVTLLNTISYRYGFMIDKAGVREEEHYGFGISFLNHFSFDWYRINSEFKSIARHGQWGISFSIYKVMNRSMSDLTWWMKDKIHIY